MPRMPGVMVLFYCIEIVYSPNKPPRTLVRSPFMQFFFLFIKCFINSNENYYSSNIGSHCKFVTCLNKLEVIDEQLYIYSTCDLYCYLYMDSGLYSSGVYHIPVSFLSRIPHEIKN